MLRFKQLLFTLYFLLNLTSCSKDNSNAVAAVSNENSDTTVESSSNSSNSNDETTESSSTFIGDGVPSVFNKKGIIFTKLKVTFIAINYSPFGSKVFSFFI